MPTAIEPITQSVDSVYAAALLGMAVDGNVVDAIREELGDLGNLLRTDSDLAKLLESRVLSTAERAGCIDRIFKGRVSDLLYRFLHVVNAKDRLAALPGIIEAFQKQLDRRNGVIEVEAYVAAAMSDDALKHVATELSAALGGQVVLHQSVDPALIGGLKLRVGDKLIDASVATQLRRLQKNIVDAGREGARATLDKYLEG